MKFILHPSLFALPVSSATISMFVHFALEGRHRIEVIERNDPTFLNWLAGRPLVDREEWHLVLDQSEVLETREPSGLIVEVTEQNVSDWSTNPPKLSLADGTQLLTTPLKVLVENSINDRAFLLCFASPEQRIAVERFEARGWLAFEHGGGITSIYSTLQNRTNPSERLTTWVLVDSDALVRGVPSNQSNRVRGLCAGNGVKVHQLGRRAIENYLPPSAVRSWALELRPQRWRAFEAFLSLTDDQRHFFNMKHGLAGDANRAEAHKLELYALLSGDVKSALDTGFGQNAHRFVTRPFSEEHLRRDGSWSEINPQVTSLINMLR